METQRLAFNTAARAYQATHPAVLMIDSDALLGDGGTPVELNPLYRGGADSLVAMARRAFP